jgi:uncharacterized Zn finger protein (UPF0148 family)
MKIWESRKKREVILCGKWRIGGIILKEKCETCKYPLVYFDKYDCNFCPNCNKWSSHSCGDVSCPFYGKRPETPFHEFYK